MATFGIRKGLEDVAHELKGIRNILASMWHSRYSDGETDRLNPEAFADEYIAIFRLNYHINPLLDLAESFSSHYQDLASLEYRLSFP